MERVHHVPQVAPKLVVGGLGETCLHRVNVIDELAIEAYLRQREERIDHDVAFVTRETLRLV